MEKPDLIWTKNIILITFVVKKAKNVVKSATARSDPDPYHWFEIVVVFFFVFSYFY